MKPPRPTTSPARVPSRPLPTGRDAATPDGGELDLDRGLGELLDDDRRDRAVRERRDRDVRRTMQRDTATFAGILRDLAEQDLAVVIEHRGGRVAGRVLALGPEHVLLQPGIDDQVVVVARWAITTVRAEQGARPVEPLGQRDVPTVASLRDVLAEFVPQRPEVALLLDGREGVVAGTLRAVGEDVATVGGQLGANPSTFVALHAVVRAVIR